MLADTDWSNTRATAAMRDAESLVQVEVGHVRTKLAGRGATHQGIQVGTIKVNLAAMIVNNVADFADLFLEYPVG